MKKNFKIIVGAIVILTVLAASGIISSGIVKVNVPVKNSPAKTQSKKKVPSKQTIKPVPAVTSVEFEKISDEIYAGDTVKLNLRIKPTGNPKYTVEYKTSRTDLINLDSDGNVNCIAPGKATVLAYVNDKVASITIEILPIKVDKLEVEVPGELTAGDSGKANVKIKMNRENAKLPELSFSSSNPSIVSIDNNGVIKAVNPGKADITVTAKDVTTNASINVIPRITTVYINNTGSSRQIDPSKVKYEIRIGTTEFYDRIAKKFNPYGDFFDYNNDVSSCVNKSDLIMLADNSHAEISSSVKELFKDMITGDQNYLNVKMVNNKMLVYLRAENQQKLVKLIDSINVSDILTEQYISFDDNIRIEPMKNPVYTGKLQVEKFDAADGMSEIKFSSSDNKVAAIDNDGNITGVSSGDVKLSFSINNKIYEMPSTIVIPEIKILSPGKGMFVMRYDKQKPDFKIETVPEDVNVKPVVTSGDNLIAAVDGEGNITGQREGSTVITVKAINKEIKIPVRVYNETTDSDGDGLTDYQEIHKYFTNPESADSDGDGIPDGDWNERREFNYTVEETFWFSKPYDIASMNDNYQDVKVLGTDGNTVKLNVVFYPYTTVSTDNIPENQNWQRDNVSNPELQQYLQPGLTTNWDEQMKKDLLKELNDYGIYPDKLTDKQLVLKVIDWYRDKFKFISYIDTYDKTKSPFVPINHTLSAKDGKVYIKDWYDPLLKEFVDHANEVNQADRINGQPWSLSDLLDRVAFGKQMYYNKTHEDCTSVPTLAATIFRALGIPTRIDSIIVLFNNYNWNPINLKNSYFQNKLKADHDGGATHYFDEVYIGDSWVRLDDFGFLNSELNTGVIAPKGLKFHFYTCRDFLDMDFTTNWSDRDYGKADEVKYNENHGPISINDNYGTYMSEKTKNLIDSINKVHYESDIQDSKF